MLAGKSITLIAAMARNRAIGLDGQMPWHLPAELRHFKEATMGKPIVMGRKTWQSIGRALPGRQNIVISRSPSLQAPGCDVAGSFEQAIALAEGDEVMIIGGGQIYAEAMPHADRMVLTLVECDPEADAWFPEWREAEWRQAGVRQHRADAENPHDYRVVEWVRREAAGDTAPAPGKSGGLPA
jgi:dihydrofolate reductase